MKKIFIILLLAVIVVLGNSCKSEFEKIRASGDPELLYNKAYEYYNNENYLKAQGLFEMVIPHYRGKKELEDIYFKYAYTYYHSGQYILASYYFKNFGTTFSHSELREEADFMKAYSHYMLSPSFRLDQSYSEKAIEDFQLFVNTYPKSERVKECNKLIDEMRKKMEIKAFDAAILYSNLQQYQAALHSFENLLKDFPETTNAEEIRYLMTRAAYLFAKNSIFEKREERFSAVIEYANIFNSKYEKSKHRKEIKSFVKKAKNKLKEIENDKRHQNESSGS